MIFDIIWMAKNYQSGFARFLNICLLILKVGVRISPTGDAYESLRSCQLSSSLQTLFANAEVNLVALDLQQVVQLVCLINSTTFVYT